ncbi:MAG: N(G),N(G)-dimethylarginine dimethylaminohydrolase [Acidipila sp.]|nr:N(G),N(G)-dimethylarginine dimethylaminohydrolase [Acidipila sp.]
MFKNAIVRHPPTNFAEGLTSAALGRPDFAKAMLQHAAYCDALKRCGLQLTVLEADPQHPDSSFVEDAAVLTRASAVLARPGAESRLGEVSGLRETLRQFFKSFHEITAPGTLDGGDICEAGNHFFIGVSRRTNDSGARQLAAILEREGYSTSLVDIRGMKSILHLKSGIAWVGEKDLVVMEEMAGREEFHGFKIIKVSSRETYAANCVRVNDHVLIPAGFSDVAASLQRLGYSLLPLEMSEFEKMDGGLSCLSLRF